MVSFDLKVLATIANEFPLFADFASDCGHSIGRVLFYGHEVTLTLYEVLWFSVMDMASGSYVIAAVVTYIMIEVGTM